MERYQELLIEMDRTFKTADHLAYVTYNIVHDLRLLINIIENLDKAMKDGMNAILEYDRLYKRISVLPEDFNLRFEIFQKKCVMRYAINAEHLNLIEKLNDLVISKEKSPMVFQRRDKYVIANQQYKLKTITIEDTKKYVQKAKTFIFKVHSILPR